MDYKVYQITKKEMFRYAAVYILADVLISLLFYRSVLAAVVFLPGICFFFREVRRELAKKRRKQLERGFLVGMRCVSTALTAGYSVENAFTQAYEELQKLYSKKEPVLQEFRRIRVGILLNRTMEELLSDLAQRSGVEDIEIFAEVFETARRTGGDLIAIIRSTTASVSQKEETRQEIEICLSAKGAEHYESDSMSADCLCGTGFTGIFRCNVSESGGDGSDEYLPWCLCVCFFDGKEDCSD